MIFVPLPPAHSEQLLDWSWQLSRSLEDFSSEWEQGLFLHVINALQGGCVGNGLQDDSQALQGILDNAPPGSMVVLPVGQYLLGATVIVPPGAAIVGVGTESVLKRGSGLSGPMIRLSDYASVQYCLLDGQGLPEQSTYDIEMPGEWAQLIGISCLGGTRNSVLVTGARGRIFWSRFLGSNSGTSGADSAVVIDAAARDAVISGNYFANWRESAVRVDGSARLLGNTFRRNHQKTSTQGGQLEISSSAVSSNVVANVITEGFSSTIGIRFGGSNHVIANNRIAGQGSHGIHSVAGTGFVINGNQVSGSGGSGILIGPSSQNFVVGNNVVTDNSGWGVRIESSANWYTASGNMTRNNTLGGFSDNGGPSKAVGVNL